MPAQRDVLDAIRARLTGRVLSIGSSPLIAAGATVREIDARAGVGAIEASPDGRPDAAVVADWREQEPAALARALAAIVRPGGSIVFTVRAPRGGWAGPGAILGVFRRRADPSFEACCEAMLHAGLRSVVAHERAGSSGLSVIAARVPEPRGDASASSVRAISGR
ncbi:MAG: hypothetical protein AB7S26_35230 [Sandaracinaceae bacterium]